MVGLLYRYSPQSKPLVSNHLQIGLQPAVEAEFFPTYLSVKETPIGVSMTISIPDRY